MAGRSAGVCASGGERDYQATLDRLAGLPEVVFVGEWAAGKRVVEGYRYGLLKQPDRAQASHEAARVMREETGSSERLPAFQEARRRGLEGRGIPMIAQTVSQYRIFGKLVGGGMEAAFAAPRTDLKARPEGATHS